MAITIFHSFAALTLEILFLPREHKIHIFKPTCNVLFITWRRDARNQFNKSKRRESWRRWTIRHSQRWHTENTPLGSRMNWRMESGAIIRDGDRKRALFLVLGLAPWYGTIFLFLEQIAPSPVAHARTLLRGFSRMSRTGNQVASEIPEIVQLCVSPSTRRLYGCGNFA